MKTKRILATLAALLMATAMGMSQSIDSIPHHYFGSAGVELRNLMEMRDESVLANCTLFDDQYMDYGSRLLKIAHNATVTDSVFIEDNDMNFFLLEPNPMGEGYVYAKVVRDLQQRRTDFAIRFFDDDLQFQTESEIRIPLNDTLTMPLADFYLLDGADIILAYVIESRNELHFARIGLDGTIRDTSTIGNYRDLISSVHGNAEMFKYNDSPTEYCLWGWHNPDEYIIKGIVVDSLLNFQELVVPMGKMFHELYLSNDTDDAMLDMGDGNLLVAAHFRASIEDGVYVAKIRKEDMEVVGFKCFYSAIQSNWGAASPLGLVMAHDGNIYYSYYTFRGATNENAAGQVAIVKMNRDLDVLWERYCLEPTGYNRIGGRAKALSKGGLALGGIVMGVLSQQSIVVPPSIFFLIVNDDGTSVDEAVVRPYAYYPNPVQDQLRLQYSPDVQPTQIALYDLQGRLVHTQNSGLENLSMAGLAAGQYVMKVTLADGKVYSDTVVKE